MSMIDLIERDRQRKSQQAAYDALFCPKEENKTSQVRDPVVETPCDGLDKTGQDSACSPAKQSNCCLQLLCPGHEGTPMDGYPTPPAALEESNPTKPAYQSRKVRIMNTNDNTPTDQVERSFEFTWSEWVTHGEPKETDDGWDSGHHTSYHKTNVYAADPFEAVEKFQRDYLERALARAEERGSFKIDEQYPEDGKEISFSFTEKLGHYYHFEPAAVSERSCWNIPFYRRDLQAERDRREKEKDETKPTDLDGAKVIAFKDFSHTADDVYLDREAA